MQSQWMPIQPIDPAILRRTLHANDRRLLAFAWLIEAECLVRRASYVLSSGVAIPLRIASSNRPQLVIASNFSSLEHRLHALFAE